MFFYHLDYKNNLEIIVMPQGHELQQTFLSKLRDQQLPVSVFLVNGIKLQGKIEHFDDHVLILQNHVRQMVFKHAVSTVVPSADVDVTA